MQPIEVARPSKMPFAHPDLFDDADVPAAPPQPYIEKTPVKSEQALIQAPPGPTAVAVSDNEADEPETPTVDLELAPTDTIEQMLAKLMFQRMVWDINGEPTNTVPDLFGQVSVQANRQGINDMRRLDALAWIFNFNPDLPRVPFDWVCDQLSISAARIRRIFCRIAGSELRRVVSLLTTVVSVEHAIQCAENLSDDLDTTGWVKA